MKPENTQWRDTAAPYFPPPMARAGVAVHRVVTRLLPCVCRLPVIDTCDMKGAALGPYLDLTLDAEPVVDGRYVVVQNGCGGQGARPYEAEQHAGWRRYDEHRCTVASGGAR